MLPGKYITNIYPNPMHCPGYPFPCYINSDKCVVINVLPKSFRKIWTNCPSLLRMGWWRRFEAGLSSSLSLFGFSIETWHNALKYATNWNCNASTRKCSRLVKAISLQINFHHPFPSFSRLDGALAGTLDTLNLSEMNKLDTYNNYYSLRCRFVYPRRWKRFKRAAAEWCQRKSPNNPYKCGATAKRERDLPIARRYFCKW